ncbi:MAG: PAS domain-containing sensor histidine kinase [Planctomycetota bacterium]|jgi:PAS domain S-box-containing protein
MRYTDLIGSAQDESLFHAVFENAGVGVVLVDPAGRILRANPAYRRMLGYEEHEAIELSYREVTHEGDLDRCTREMEEFFDSGRTQQQVYKRYRRKDGGVVWGRVTISAIRDPKGELDVLIAIVADVTNQILAERTARFQAELLDVVRESIICTDIDGRITYWGQGAQQLYGYAAEEVLGEPIFIIFPEDNPPRPNGQCMSQARRHGSWSGRQVQRRKDGTRFWADTTLSLLVGDDGEPSGFIGIDRDISELKQRERDLTDLAERLQEIREDERTSIAREVHDELGQALTALKFDASWLEKQANGGELLERLASMRALIDSTLDAVRGLGQRLRPALLDDLGLQSAVEWQANDFEQRTGIACRCDVEAAAELVPHTTRDTAVFRILQEALTNVARHAAASNVTIELSQLPAQLRLKVMDDGCGMASIDVTGTGALGLLGMRERARALGGRIEFASTRGKGTHVVVTLPL